MNNLGEGAQLHNEDHNNQINGNIPATRKEIQKINQFLKTNIYYKNKLSEANLNPESLIRAHREALQIIGKLQESLDIYKNENHKKKEISDLKKMLDETKKNIYQKIMKQEIIRSNTEKNHIQTYSLSEIDEIKANLEIGDVLMFRRDTNNSNIDTVRLGQTAANVLNPKRKNEYRNTTHAAISIGDGKFVEATPPRVKITTLEERLLKKQKKEFVSEILVYRPRIKEVATGAAMLGIQIAKESLSIREQHQEHDTSSHPYDYKNSTLSLIKKDAYNEEAKKDFMRWALWNNAYWEDPLAMKSLIPVVDKDERAFYCSNFVGWCFQTAESNNFIQQLNYLELELPSREILRNTIALKTWIDTTIREHPDLLDYCDVMISKSAKNLSPRSLIDFIDNEPDLWELRFRIIHDPEK